jgi:hypothetical protein
MGFVSWFTSSKFINVWESATEFCTLWLHWIHLSVLIVFSGVLDFSTYRSPSAIREKLTVSLLSRVLFISFLLPGSGCNVQHYSGHGTFFLFQIWLQTRILAVSVVLSFSMPPSMPPSQVSVSYSVSFSLSCWLTELSFSHSPENAAIYLLWLKCGRSEWWVPPFISLGGSMYWGLDVECPPKAQCWRLGPQGGTIGKWWDL